MITVKPFKALRPQPQFAKDVASRPYDVLNSAEAKIEAQGNPNSFLHITKSEIGLADSVDIHSQEVYDKAKENLTAFIKRDVLFRENKECFYIYRLIMNGKSQTGLVAASSVEDYENGLIKKHELTRPEKEKDRIDHMSTIMAQTGNVFLAYKNNEKLDEIITKWQDTKSPMYDFTATDGVQHTLWIVNDDATVAQIENIFKTEVEASYIADGHHRAASASKVKAALGDKAPQSTSYFLTTLFPSNQLHILDYNRVVKGLNGLSHEDLFKALSPDFEMEMIEDGEPFRPTKPHEFGMYIHGNWYKLNSRPGTFTQDPIGILDVSVLSNNILSKHLGITDQRTDPRIDFVGGIRGLKELQSRVDSGDFDIAFSIYPVSIEQLFAIADTGGLMPPKSTWFEPKLRDGLLTHILD